MHAVIGATGRTGGAVARALRARGLPVRVVVRAAERGQTWAAAGAEIALASLDDGDALTAALRGVRGVYAMLPFEMTRDDLEARALTRATTLRRALLDADVRRTVFLSSVGVHAPDGPFAIERAAESELASLGDRITFLRGPYFLENFAPLAPVVRARGVLPSPFDAARPLAMASVDDVGDLAASCLMDARGTVEPRFDLVGLEDPSLNDVACAFGDALGRTVTTNRVTERAWGESARRAGASEAAVALQSAMIRAVENGRVSPDPTSRIVRGRVSVAAFARRLFS